LEAREEYEMPNEPRPFIVDIYLREYDKLKDEQIARIGFRDNLIYATLVAIGGVLSFALASSANHHALLLLPLANVVIGWTYINNDQKISSIGRYIRSVLIRNLQEATREPDARFFAWEFAPLIEQQRLGRKLIQLAVNEALFVGSGLVALIAFFLLVAPIAATVWWIAGIELLLLGILAVQIGRYADIRPHKRRAEGKVDE
jgi:hypothetical protein